MLCNHYWQLRSVRKYDQAGRRRWYRKIEDEKKRLLSAGVDAEEIRLFCRWMANPQNQGAEMRWQAYAKQLKLDL